MRKNKMRAVFRWIPAIVVMAAVFLFSAADAVQSDATSSPIAKTVLKVVEMAAGTIEPQERVHLSSLIHTLVRKTAHLTEYAFLGICYLYAFDIKDKKKTGYFITAVLLSALYASGDEFHQTFVPGRSGQVTDVLIDTTGAAIGAGLMWLIVYRKPKERRKKL